MPTLKEQTIDALEKLLAFLEHSPWKNQYYFQVKEMRTRLDEPCVLAVAGRVKAGKSSFLNAFLGDDLALVGTTETTATINYFRYGVPDDPKRPIHCIWQNGRESWEPREFLDSLQGNTIEVLQKASGIRQLEFFVNNPKLQHICLVDTPGTGAIVGEDGAGHENVTRDFFNMQKNLRDQHHEETLHISRDADAVIYLTGEVGQSRDADFLGNFQDGAAHAFNTIGIMSKIDLSDDLMEKRDFYAGHMANLLAEILPVEIPVLPVSAGIQRVLDTKTPEDWTAMRQALLQGFTSRDALCKALSSDTIYRMERLPGCSMAAADRKQLRGGMPWRVFVVIAKQLFDSDVDAALTRLRELAGFDAVSALMEQHFFQRGILLRCHTVIQDGCKLLYTLIRQELYRYREQSDRDMKECSEYIDFIMSHPDYRNNETANKLRRFIKDHLPADHSAEYETELNRLLMRFENLLYHELASANRNFEGARMLEEYADVITPDEKNELGRLFGILSQKEEDNNPDYCRKRQMFWRQNEFMARTESRKKLAELVAVQYAALLHKSTGKA